MTTTYKAAPDIDVITTTIPIADFGLLAANAFVLHGSEPVLVDTGVVIERDDFLTALRSVIDPSELRWIWLSHPDADHIGGLAHLLDENPHIRVITTFLTVGILGLSQPLPMDRLYLLNPGQSITVGDRTLTAVKPPAWDNPASTGFFEERSRTLFTVDCFGALLPAVPQNAADLGTEELRQGQAAWAVIDAPWLHKVDTAILGKDIDRIRSLDPAVVLSSHLPAAPGTMLPQLITTLEAAPASAPFEGPDQVALEAMLAALAGMAGAAETAS